MKLNWDAHCFFPVESKVCVKECMNSAPYEYRKMSARIGAHLCPLDCRLSVGKPSPPRPRKCCHLDTIACYLMLLSSMYLLFKSKSPLYWLLVNQYNHTSCTPLSVFQVLNSHGHVMHILSILLAKYTAIKVSLKSRKTMAYTKLTTTKVWRLMQCI